jgi:glucose-6-phosphatase
VPDFRLLHGERPYWWTRESAIPVDLVQTPVTCETGPGNPSGHVMLSVVLWFTMYDVITKILGENLL